MPSIVMTWVCPSGGFVCGAVPQITWRGAACGANRTGQRNGHLQSPLISSEPIIIYLPRGTLCPTPTTLSTYIVLSFIVLVFSIGFSYIFLHQQFLFFIFIFCTSSLHLLLLIYTVY